MRVYRVAIIISIILYALTGSAVACNATDGQKEYAACWKTLFDESERIEKTDEDEIYRPKYLNAHNSFYKDIYYACKEKALKSGLDYFHAVAVVDKAGEIEQFLIMPPLPELECFSDSIVGQSYPAPPFSPYYVGFVIYLAPPGTPPKTQTGQGTNGDLQTTR